MSNNRSEVVDKSGKKKYHKSTLTPLKKKFAQEYAKTDNATRALLTAYGDRQITYGSAGVQANRLLKNDNVSMEIEYQRGKLEQLASKAVNRVESLINSENEQVATANVWKTIEQVQGKAVQQIKTENTSVNVVVTLK